MISKKNIKIALLILVIAGLGWFFSTQKNTEQIRQDIVPIEVASEESIKIIAFGDSLTAGYGVSQAEAYPAQLEVVLRGKGYVVSVTNSGVSGETTRGNLERANFIRSQDPNIVILGIGGNDALRALPLEETEKNIRATVEVLRGGEQPPYVLLLRMQAPLNSGRGYKDQFDALYETIASDNKLVLIPFMTEEIFLNTENKIPDGVHYNQIGYQKVVEQHMLPILENILNMTY